MKTLPDPELDALLAASDLKIAPARLHHVRTSILVAAHSMARQSLAGTIAGLFSLRPAMLVATGLLGLFLGASLPSINLDSPSAAFLDDHPQGFLTGDFG